MGESDSFAEIRVTGRADAYSFVVYAMDLMVS